MANWWDSLAVPDSAFPKPAPSLPTPSQGAGTPSTPLLPAPPASNDLLASLRAGRDSQIAAMQQAASAPTPSLPTPPQPKPGFDLGNVGSALWEGATQQLLPGLKSAAAQAYTGINPVEPGSLAERWMAEGRQAQEQSQTRLEQLRQAGQTDSSSEAIREAMPSLGFSIVNVAGALPAGLLAGAAGTAAGGPVAGGMAGSAAAGSVGAALGYRMAGSQLLNDSLAEMEKESQTQRGRGLSAEERNRAVEVLTPIAQDTGLWEAGPEFVGNAMMFGLGRVALGFLPKQSMAKLAQTALGRAGVRAAAGAGALGTEIGTEGITQFNQGPNQQRADAATQAILEGQDPQAAMAGVKPMYQGVEGLWQATKDVAPATVATVLMMGGIAKPVHMAGAAIENRRAGNARVDQAEQDTAALRANLDVANEQDIAQALSGFDQLETQGLPKHAAARLEQARQQLTRELELRASPESLAEPLETARGRAGYLGLAERADSLSDEQLLQAASRPLPQDVAPEIAKAHKIYGAELAKRQKIAQVVDQLQDPDAAKIMSSTLGRITSGKPLAQGGYGSRDFNLASLSDDMLERYRLAADVLGQSDTASNSVQTARDALNQEAERRASGQRRDPESIRLSETAVKVALAPEAKMAAMLKGLSTEGLDRIADRLNELATANPLLADRARTVLEQVRQARMQQFNPSGTQQAGITAAMQGWNQGQGRPAQPSPGRPVPAEQGQQPTAPIITRNIPTPAATGQSMLADALQRQQALQQEVAGLNQQPAAPTLPTPPQWGGSTLGGSSQPIQAAPQVGPSFAPQPLSGPAELTSLLGTNPPAPTLPTPAPPQGPTSLADLLGRDARLDVVPSSVSAQGPVAPPAPTPRLPSLPNVQTSQTAQQAAPPVVVPTGPEGARGARAEGTGAAPRTAAGTVVPQDLASAVRGGPTGRESIPTTATPSQPETTREKGQTEAEAAPLLSGQNAAGTGQSETAASPRQQVSEVEQQLFDQLLSRVPTQHMLANDSNELFLQAEFIKQEISRLLGKWTVDQLNENPSSEIGAIVNRLDADWNNRDYAEAKTRELIDRAKAMQRTKTPEVKPTKARSPKSEPAPGAKPDLTPAPPTSLSAAPTQKGVTTAGKPAPTWNEANSSQRAQILKDTGASDDFSKRKAAEWNTWAAIPEGPIKKRIRDVLEDRASQDNAGKETTPAPKTIETPAGPAKATPGGPGTIAIELPVGATAATPATEAYGKANKIFTEDAAAKARELLKRKLGQLNTGLDPEMIQAGITLAGYHIEAGARAFAAYSKAMIADLGEAARPFLRSWYEGVRYYPGFDANGMSSAKEIDALAEREADTKTEIKSDQAPPTKTTGSRALADLIKTFLRETSGNLTIPQFWGMANKAFGGSQAQGTYNSKDAYDAMELGLNLAVLADENAPLRGQDSDQVRSAIGYLEALQNRLPTQTKRDDEQQKMQQFSTPHTHAHIVAWAAGIGRNDVVLEPTAGTGNLVAHAKLFGPRSVVANELSERRDALLRQIPGVRVFNENANHLNAVLPADVKPTVVLMNPPFSADVNLPGKKDLELGATHIEQALARLQPGGRLVAIVGRGMAMDAPRFKKWWNDIEKRYNVRANIAISGKEYTKFGTSFDNRILVIDKTGQTGLRSNIVQGEVSRVEELVDRLGGVRRERVEQQNAAGATSQTGVDRTENQSGAGQSVSAATDQEGVGGSGTVPGVAAGSGRPAGRAGPSGRNAGTGARTDNSGAGANRGRGVRSDRPEPDAGGVDSGTGVPAENQPERTGRAAQEVGELETSGAMGPTDAEGFGTSAFESYRPTTSFKSAKPHPTPLSESAAMGSVKFPPLNYSPKLPADVVNDGRLSAAQLETVAYAGQAHEQILPNGERRGFFVGDGTGVGKGAQIAGIILDNWNRGRKKAVWISENSPLFADAQRDAEWVGLGKDRLLLQGKIKGEISAKEGVLFTTYSTLTNSEKDKDGKPGAKRIDQIITWLGKDFDGVIAFDEAHSMSNALQSKGSRGTVKPSQTALAGIELQKALPKARVVYVSATGATEVRNLVYASRLGLWGEGTAFGSAIDFVSDINGGGLAAMEVVAKDMKAMGSYTARSLSYDGVEVEQLAHELSPEQAKTYDELARAWQITLAHVDAAMEASGSKQDAQARSSALSAFWGAHQRFFNAVLTALSAPSLLADAKRQLDAGQSVIMQLVNTDEATMKRRLAQASDTGQTLEELDLTPRDVLMQYLQHSFPTTLYEPYLDDNGNEGVRPVVDASGNVVQDPDAIARRDRLLENIATLKVPESILDQIINHFGSDAVAEITGRSRRIVRQQDGTAKMEKLGAAKRRGDAADFDNGKRRILVFSDAGGTGRSYHADLRIPNQQKRVHYLVQPGWRADKAIQGLGRSHRTNQAQPPLFKTVTTTIKSQARFVSSIARRMNQMGALTKGQRDATSGQGMFDDDMNLENEYSQQALVSLFHAIAAGEVQGVTVSDIEQQMGVRFIDPKTGQILRDKIPNIQRFLNRLLSLDIAMMDRVFDEFDTRRRNNIEYAKQQGFYDQGMETLRAISVKKDEDVVAITHPGGSTTRYVNLTVTHESKLLPFDSLHPDAFFARNKSSGKLYAFEPATSITNPETGELIERVRRVSPDSVRYMPVREAGDREKYDRLDLTNAQKKTEWAKETAATPKTYDQTLHLVSGALLPVWDRLPRDGSSRVIRAQTDTKERLIGRVIENKSLKETLTRLGVSRDAPKLDGRQAINAIVQNNATIELANGWKLVRRTVNNQPRIEVLNVETFGDRSVLIDMGAFSEIINYQSRLFLPSDNANILDRLFASKPVVDVVEPSIRRSVPSSTAKPATVAHARATLVKALGEKHVTALERAGRLMLHEKDPTKTGAAGYVDGKGVIHLIPANMDQTALDVALHEAMHLARDDRFSEGERAKVRLAHAALRLVGLKNFVGNPGFNDLVQQVRRMAAEGNKTAQDALAKARLEDPNNIDEEAIAYLAQYADEKLPLVRRVLAAIRAALYRMGIKVNLTPADVRALALSALKAQARAANREMMTARRVEAFSQPTTDEDAAEQERLWAEFQAVRAQFQARAPSETAFKRWFGKGTEGITARNGQPITLYHGTNNPEFNRWDESRSGQASDHPTSGLGFFMTADRRAAKRYGSRVLELHARINKPYYMTDADLTSIETVQDAKRFRRKLLAHGYDGAVVTAPGGAPYVIVFNSNQAKYINNLNPSDSEDFRFSKPLAWENSSSSKKGGQGSRPNSDITRGISGGISIGNQRNNGINIPPRALNVSSTISDFTQKRMDRVEMYAKFFGDDMTRNAIINQGFDSLNIKTQRMVMSRMISPLHDSEIFRAVIETIPVDMMHNIIDRKFDSGNVFNYPSMFLNNFTGEANTPVKLPVIKIINFLAKTHPSIVAMLRAKFSGFQSSGTDFEFGATTGTINNGHGIAPSQRAVSSGAGVGAPAPRILSDKTTEYQKNRYSRPGRPSLAHPREAAKVLGDIGELRDTIKPGEKALAKLNPTNWRQMLADLKANTRPQWLGLLTQDHLLELARKHLPAGAVRQFDDASERMEAYENRMIQAEGFPLADRWQTLMRNNRAQADALGLALHMSTWLGVDPRQTAAPKGKQVEWVRAKAALSALTNPEARKLYDDVLGFYANQTKRLFEELEQRIQRHSLPEPDKRAARDLLRQEFERMKDEGPYVPLMRFGDLTVWAEPRNPGEKPVFATLETVQDQRAFADWLKSQGYQPRLGVKMDEITKRALPAGDMVGKLTGIIDKNLKGPQADAIKDAMYQLFLRSLPEQAIRKHFLHRKFVPGYSADAIRTFATFARRSAKQVARLAHGDRMGGALDEMAKAVRDGTVNDPVAAGHLVNELDKSYQWSMDPQTADWASRLTHLGFMWHLGASPAHLLLNLGQQAQLTLPWLAGELHDKKGFAAVAAALGKANLDFLRTNPFTDPAKRGTSAKTLRARLEGEYGGDLGRALKALEEAGKTDKSQTYSISGMSSEDQFLWSRPWLRKITQGAAWFFHTAEVINREASAIAAYRLGRESGMGHEAAYDLARRAINETHYDYSPGNRSRFMRGNVAKVITLFKQYALNTSWQLARNAYLSARGATPAEKAVARTKLRGMLGMTALMAGAVGLPFYNELAWMLTQLMTAFGDDDEPEWDFDTWFRRTLDDALNPTASEAARRGLANAFVGIDLSSRIKLDDLWWRRTEDDQHGRQVAYSMLEQALGPVAGLAVRGISTVDGLWDALIEGTSARGASTRTLAEAMPKALKDISKSLRFATEGATTASGAPLMSREELGTGAIVGQAIGFRPAALTERQSANTAMLNLQDRIKRRRTAILDTLNMAVWQGDGEVIGALQSDIAAFNKRYPAMAITGDTIQNSIEAGARRRLELQLFGGAPLDRRLAPMLLSGEREE